MNYKFIKQKTKQDCGLAVSCMLINYLQRAELSLEELKYQNMVFDSEMSFYNIELLLEKYQVEFKSYYASYEELCELQINEPVVLNLLVNDFEHFIVVYKFKASKVLVADPAANDIKWIEISSLQKTFTGYFAIARRITKFKYKKESIFNWAHLMFEETKLICIFFTTSFFLNISILIANGFLKTYAMNVNVDDSTNKLIIFTGYAFLFLIQILLSWALSRLLFQIRTTITKKIYVIYFDQLLIMESEQFDTNKKEVWLKKIMHINTLTNFLTQAFLTLPSQAILFVMSIILVSLISPSFLVIILLENFLAVTCSLIFNGFLKNRILENNLDSIAFSVLFREILDGNKEIKTKNIADVYRKKIYTSFSKNLNNENHLNEIKNANTLVTGLINKMMFLILFFIAQTLILASKMSFQQLLFYVSISAYIAGFSETILGLVLNKDDYKLSLTELKFLFSNSKVEEDLIEIDKITKIEAKDLYKYKNEICILRDVSCKITSNTFIYGKSGVGKTTLLQIFSGVIGNYEGKIYLNDVDFADVNKDKFKDQVLYVGQYDYLFNSTVWANLQHFKNKIDLGIFAKYNFLEVLQSHNIELNKIITDNGENLSKGQRQIINFMAAFFAKKELYLIDEPLSNVDRPTAYNLLKNFLEYKQGKLIIMCDHNDFYQKYFTNLLVIGNEK